MPVPRHRDRTALVLAGGAARGAYEVGVVQHILEEVSKDLGRDVRFDILSGTSVGALNACGLAAYADLGPARVGKLIDVWTSLDISELVRPDVRSVLEMWDRIIRRRPSEELVRTNDGGLVDPTGLEHLVEKTIPFERISENIRAGHLAALTVSTTHVKSGRTVVYVQSNGELPTFHDASTLVKSARITMSHALASAAIPILFRSVALDGHYHSDGGLRQNVPLSPARRLGARRIFVVNPRFVPTTPLEPASGKDQEERPGLLFLLGKTLNALLLDRIDSDIGRLRTINRILEAGTEVAGADFVTKLNEQLGYSEGEGFYPLDAMMIRTTKDIGKMAAQFVQSPSFSRIGGMTGRLMRQLADRDSRNEADLLSYLLFDGEFARQLIEMGRSDAKMRHDELCRFFDPRP